LKLKLLRKKELNRELTKDEELELFENESKRLREGTHNPQRIVREDELERRFAIHQHSTFAKDIDKKSR